MYFNQLVWKKQNSRYYFSSLVTFIQKLSPEQNYLSFIQIRAGNIYRLFRKKHLLAAVLIIKNFIRRRPSPFKHFDNSLENSFVSFSTYQKFSKTFYLSFGLKLLLNLFRKFQTRSLAHFWWNLEILFCMDHYYFRSVRSWNLM